MVSERGGPAAMTGKEERELDFYEKGETSYFALRADQRFGYCLYVPRSFALERSADYALAVIVHGSGRTPQAYRSLFGTFAEAHGCLILAPMFPSHIFVDGKEANYKFLLSHGIRFDHLLLAMVDEVVERYRLVTDALLMHGFSGGGHFAHRFFYLHPERLSGVSIGAPGMVTLLDSGRDWHCGTRGMAELFGKEPDIAAMRRVPVQMIIGGDDTETWEITIGPDDPLWMPEVNDAGRTRLDRIHALQRSFEAEGIAVRLDTVPGVGHKGFELLGPVEAFFSSILKERRARLPALSPSST